MPEYIRALIVILILASAVFVFAKAPVTAFAMSAEDFVRRRNTWYLITLASFLSQSYWIFVIILILILVVTGKKENNKIALLFFIIHAVPLVDVEIPGFAGIRYLLSIDYLRIITITLLLPVALDCRRKSALNGRGWELPDVILTLYIIYNITLVGRGGDLVAMIRESIGWLIDVALPYYAISRYIRDLKAFGEILMSLVLASMVSAMVAVFEISRSWMLYNSFADALSLEWTTGYLDRGDFIRAVSSSGQSIVLGYILTVAIGFYLYFYNNFESKSKYALGFILLIAGWIAPLSKGPWVATVILIFLFILTGKSASKNIAKLGILIALFGVILMAADKGGNIEKYLPFVSGQEDESITYRARLFDVSLGIILDNPIFGSTDFYSRMEELRTGAGIIDPVNHYIGVALYSGLLGLSLFTLFFGVIMFSLYRKMKTHKSGEDMNTLGRSLFATLFSVLFMISAVSSIYHVPIYYYCIAAFSYAYCHIQSNQAEYSVKY